MENKNKKTLLELAMEKNQLAPQSKDIDEEIEELTIAWIKDYISLKQASEAIIEKKLYKSSSSAHKVFATALKNLWHKGILKV